MLDITPDDFCHLHCHSDKSLLDGVSSPLDHAIKAKEIGQNYLCITDHGYLTAIPEQIRVCDSFKLPYILGVEGYINRTPKLSKDELKELSDDEKKKYKKSHHILLIAYNHIGYENLVNITSFSHLHGFYNRPRMTFDILQKYKEGLIVSSCCISSEVGWAFCNQGEEAAEALVLEYKETFGENYYLEIMMLDYEPQKNYDKFVIKMAHKHNIPLILTQDVHYASKEDHETQTNLLLVQTGRTRSELDKLIATGDNDVFEQQDKQLYLKSVKEIVNYWETTEYKEIIPADILIQAMKNTIKIAEKSCHVKIDRSIKLPIVPNADEELIEQIKIGFKKRGLSVKNEKYRKRIADEYDLIYRKGFQSYFLIQQKIILEARRYCEEILKSPGTCINIGRGSAASSLILYLLGITQVDPLKHDLLFSRFLSEGRGRQIDYKFDQKLLTKN